MAMKLDGVYLSLVKTARGYRKVRISIGDYMFFDSPNTTTKNAKIILDNLKRRLSK